jgi:rhodanese-related sulfurtransferase
MNKLVALLLLPLTLTAVAADAPEEASMRTRAGLYVDAREAHKMLTSSAGHEVVLVDVRDPVELKFTGYTNMVNIHVPWKIIDASTWNEKKQSYGGYVNKNFGADVKARLDALGVDKQARIIFMCRSGATRSAPAADALFAMGYPNVYSMVDGFEGDKSRDGVHKGARVVNGWKNSELPWGWKLEKDVIYGLK